MGYARVLISCELLVESLHFPSGTEVKVVRMEDERTVEITISHSDLPEVLVDGRPLFVAPIFKRNWDPVEFVNWGITGSS